MSSRSTEQLIKKSKKQHPNRTIIQRKMSDVKILSEGESNVEKLERNNKELKKKVIRWERASLIFLFFFVWATIVCCIYFPTYYTNIIYFTVVRDSCFLLSNPNVTETFTTGLAKCHDCRTCGLVSCDGLLARNKTGDCCGDRCDDDSDHRIFCFAQYGKLYNLEALVGVNGGHYYVYKSSSFVDFAPIAKDVGILSSKIFDCWHYYANYDEIYLGDDKIEDKSKIKNDIALILPIIFTPIPLLLLFAAIFE